MHQQRLPLTIWLVFALARMPDASWQEATAWIARPFNAVLLLAFLTVSLANRAPVGVSLLPEDFALLIGAWTTLISIAAKYSPQQIEVRKETRN